MADPRVVDHVKIIVNHSCKVQRGDFVLILGNPEAHDLVVGVASELGRVGAQYIVLDRDDTVIRAHLLAADDETISTVPAQLINLMNEADVFINLATLTSPNSQELSDISPHKLQLNAKARGPLSDAFASKRWNITLHPTRALAQDAKMSFDAFCDFVYSAILRDWPKFTSEMKVLHDKMAATKQVHITGKETDISLSIEGRSPITDGGEKNMPGGRGFCFSYRIHR